jgi:hypothetical protein
MLGSLAIVFASAAGAAEHYVEIWNPPEVHHRVQDFARQWKKPDRSHRRHASRDTNARIAKQRVSAADGSERPVASAPGAKRRPRFDDIPRKMPPEGNVLRVGHAATFGRPLSEITFPIDGRSSEVTSTRVVGRRSCPFFSAQLRPSAAYQALAAQQDERSRANHSAQ